MFNYKFKRREKMYFDTHAHYDDEKFDENRDTLIEEMHSNGVDYIINIGSDMESSVKSMELAKKYDFIYAAVGVHPHEVKDMTEADIERLREYSKYEKVVAIGEIGLDYYYDFSPRDKQKYWFERQLELAAELDLPVSIHSRDAAQETFDIIKNSRVRKGVIHAYSGSVEMARDYIDMGFYIGVGGVVTFKNAKKLVDVVGFAPMERILLETDSPYLSPVPLRGTVNNSQNLKYVADKIGEIKQISPEKVCEITSQNAKVIFWQKKVVA